MPMRSDSPISAVASTRSSMASDVGLIVASNEVAAALAIFILREFLFGYASGLLQQDSIGISCRVLG